MLIHRGKCDRHSISIQHKILHLNTCPFKVCSQNIDVKTEAVGEVQSKTQAPACVEMTQEGQLDLTCFHLARFHAVLTWYTHLLN